MERRVMREVRCMFQRDSVYRGDFLKCQAVDNVCEKLITDRITFLANRSVPESSIF